MTIQLELTSEMDSRVQEQAASLGQDAAAYISGLVRQELIWRELGALRDRNAPQRLADLKPRIPTPPGANWLESIRGQWPGDESDEEIESALARMS